MFLGSKVRRVRKADKACYGDSFTLLFLPYRVKQHVCRKNKTQFLIIGLCILLRVYRLNIGITSLRNKVFLVLDFIVQFSH
jgi:hypothetical protein